MKSKRLYYIDWLRVLAFGLLFIFHTVRFFDSYPWHIKNEESSLLANYFVEFTHSWRMPLIFLISGVGTYFAIRSKKENFIKDRVMRLIVPFVFGIVALIPPQKYFEAVFQSTFNGSYWSFLVAYPATLFDVNMGITLVWTGHIGYHIWYLAYLFLQTILFLPILHFFMSSQMTHSLTSRLTSNIHSIWLLLLPFIFFDFLLRPVFPGYLNWADFAVYSLFFLYGFLFQINEKFIRLFEQYALLFLLIGIICWIGYLLNKETFDQMSLPEHSWSYLGTVILKNINSFSWVIAILGFGKRLLNFSHPLLLDLNQGILPFYILHQTVIIIFGYYIIQWNLSVLEKFVFIFTTALVVTIGLYQLIRSNNVMRFLFGMKKKAKTINVSTVNR